MPKISVIVPVYKVEPYLHRCVDSILGQTFADFELILVDDGSPDNCGAICDEYAQRDSRVVVIHQKNGGLSAARNAGIDWAFANSDSQWLTFVDSDDWLHPEMLESLLHAALESRVRVSVCGYIEAENPEPVKPCNQVRQLWKPEDFYAEHHVNAVVAWGKLYHRDCFAQIRYPVGKLHEDEFVTYRVLFAETQIAVISAPMYFYFVNTAGISKSRWKPSRLHGLEALEAQIGWFGARGFRNARTACILAYIGSIVQHIQTLQTCRDQELDTDRYLQLLRRKLRCAILRFRKWYPLENHCWIYEMAFPSGMKMYWYFIAAEKKLRNILGHK